MPRRHRVEVYEACEALVAAQVSPGKIARQVAKKFGNISERQVHRYVAQIFDDLAKQSEKHKPARKHQLRQSLQAVFQKAMQANQLGAAVAALDRLGKLDGLWEPTQIKVEHNNVDLMTSDQQRKRLFELAAKAGVAPVKPNGNGHANGANGHGTNGANGHDGDGSGQSFN